MSTIPIRVQPEVHQTIMEWKHKWAKNGKIPSAGDVVAMLVAERVKKETKKGEKITVQHGGDN